MLAHQEKFIELAIAQNALQFGQFSLKSGRQSPYFFNAAQFNTGASLKALGQCFIDTLLHHNADYDMLFGPAYKGISLGTAAAIASNRDLPVAFNRKETKDHGEGGLFIGAPIAGKVLIIDDVITNGGAKIEAIQQIQSQGATVSGIIIAIDREERGQGELSAKQEIEKNFQIPVYAIVTLDMITQYLENYPKWEQSLHDLRAYQNQYGVQPQI